MFTRQQAERLLDESISMRSELDEIEHKSDFSNSFQHALCAMSNRRDRNGGIVFLGITRDFGISGVADLEGAQKQSSDMASDLFNVPLRVAPEVLTREGKAVLAVIVPACPAGHRPCHFKRHGILQGAWIRVGNTSRKMTAEEVRREIAADEVARGTVPPFDMMPYLASDVNDLEDPLVAAYVERVAKIRPGSRIQSLSHIDVLRSVKAIAELNGKLYPTPAGLLFFCRETQRHLPQSSVEFMHLWGPELTSLVLQR